MESRSKHWSPADIDSQQNCPFYNGRIPQEITDLIFEYALSPDTSPSPESGLNPGHDFQVRYDHEQSQDEPAPQPQIQEDASAGTTAAFASSTQVINGGDASLATPQNDTFNSIVRQNKSGFDWFRPDTTGQDIFRGHDLLRACRRVYLDTHKVIERARDIVLYEGRAPFWGSGLNVFKRKLETTQGDRYIKAPSIRWFAQMYRLEEMAKALHPSTGATASGDSHGREILIGMLSRGQSPTDPVWRIFHDLEHFHITIRRTDWFRWEDNKVLAINPYRYSNGTPSWEMMRRDMQEGRQSPVDERAWAVMFRGLRNLKTLTISFETSEDKKGEMEEIVEWARTWRFDIMSWRHWLGVQNLDRAACLVAEDRPPKKMSWRGLKHHWSDYCTACGSDNTRPECAFCLRKQALINQGKGPRLLVWTVTWKPVPVVVPASGEDNGSNAT